MNLGVTGWERLRHGGPLLEDTRLVVLSRYVSGPQVSALRNLLSPVFRTPAANNAVAPDRTAGLRPSRLPPDRDGR